MNQDKSEIVNLRLEVERLQAGLDLQLTENANLRETRRGEVDRLRARIAELEYELDHTSASYELMRQERDELEDQVENERP